MNRGVKSVCGLTVSDIGLGTSKMAPVRTSLRGVTSIGSGSRVIPLVTRLTRDNMFPCFDFCINTSVVSDGDGLFRLCRKNVDLNRGRCCLSGSSIAIGVHGGCGRRVMGVFRLTNFSRTTTGGGVRTMVSVRAHVTGTSFDTIRRHGPTTGCRGVSLSRLGGRVLNVS